MTPGIVPRTLTERDKLIDMINDVTEQKNNAYSERNKVVAALAHLLNTTLPFGVSEIGIAQHQGDEWDNDWRTVLVISLLSKNLEVEQITWHFHDSEKYLLDGLPIIENYQYDGHTTEEKYQRLFDFVGIKQLTAEASE